MTPTDADDPLRTTDHPPNATGQCNELTTDSPPVSGLDSTGTCRSAAKGTARRGARRALHGVGLGYSRLPH